MITAGCRAQLLSRILFLLLRLSTCYQLIDYVRHSSLFLNKQPNLDEHNRSRCPVETDGLLWDNTSKVAEIMNFREPPQKSRSRLIHYTDSIYTS